MDYFFKFTLQEVQLMASVLSKAPYETVAPLLNNIQQQITQQEAQARQKEKAPE